MQNVSIGKCSFKYPIEKPKYPNKFIRNVEYPINICNTQMNEKGVGNIPNCSKN